MKAWILAIALALGLGVAIAQDPPQEAAAMEEVVVDEGMPAGQARVAAEPETVAGAAAGEEEGPPEAPLGWLFAFLSGGGIMGIAQMLRFWNITEKIPAWVRPLIGPAIALLANQLAVVFNAPLDLSPITAALVGSLAGTMFNVGKGAGLFSPKADVPLLRSTGSGK